MGQRIHLWSQKNLVQWSRYQLTAPIQNDQNDIMYGQASPVCLVHAFLQGNFLLCMGILLCGGSATKVFTMFKHMGLRCISFNTFIYHQRVSFLDMTSDYRELQLLSSSFTGIIQGSCVRRFFSVSARFGRYNLVLTIILEPS